MDWELHRPFIQKAEVLVQLLKEAEDPTFQKYYRSPASETLDTYIKKNNFYSNDYKEMSNRYVWGGGAWINTTSRRITYNNDYKGNE